MKYPSANQVKVKGNPEYTEVVTHDDSLSKGFKW